MILNDYSKGSNAKGRSDPLRRGPPCSSSLRMREREREEEEISTLHGDAKFST